MGYRESFFIYTVYFSAAGVYVAESSDRSPSNDDEFVPVVIAVGAVACVLAILVLVLCCVLCWVLYSRRRRRRHQISTKGTGKASGTARYQAAVSSQDKKASFSNDNNRMRKTDINGVIVSDGSVKSSTTSSNLIRVSDGSGSNAGQALDDATMVTVELQNQDSTSIKKPLNSGAGTLACADYDEIEETPADTPAPMSSIVDGTGTMLSAVDSTLSTVSSFSSGEDKSGSPYHGRDSYVLDGMEPGAHGTPRFPHLSNFLAAGILSEHESTTIDSGHIATHDYERDPDYNKPKKLPATQLPPPAHIYQALQQSSRGDRNYKSPDRPSQRGTPGVLKPPGELGPYSVSVPPWQENYTELRSSTLDPLQQYTHLNISTKERNSSAFITTEL